MPNFIPINSMLPTLFLKNTFTYNFWTQCITDLLMYAAAVYSTVPLNVVQILSKKLYSAVQLINKWTKFRFIGTFKQKKYSISLK